MLNFEFFILETLYKSLNKYIALEIYLIIGIVWEGLYVTNRCNKRSRSL
ncbi:hypothetical protein UT300007_35420 [Clostridium sp. CTA-7]